MGVVDDITAKILSEDGLEAASTPDPAASVVSQIEQSIIQGDGPTSAPQVIDALQPRITEPANDEEASEGRFSPDLTQETAGQFTDLAGQAFQGFTGKGPSVAANMLPEATPEGVRALLTPTLDLALSALGAAGAVPAGAAGFIGDMAEAAGMSSNDARRLANDLAAMPEAFAASPMRATMPAASAARSTPASRASTPAGRVIQEGAERGVRVMTSDVREPKTWAGKWIRATGEKIPVAGTGAGRAAQAEERVDAVRGLVNEFSDDAGAATDDILRSVSDDLIKTHGKTVSRYVGLKDEVFDSVSGAGPVPVPKVSARIDELIAANEGKATMAPLVAELRKWRSDLPANTDIRDLDGLRATLGDAYKDPRLAGAQTQVQKSVNSLYGPLREDIDAFVQANGKPRDLTKLRVANKRLSDGMDEVNKTALKSVLAKGDVTPENVKNLLFSSKPSDVRQVYKRLSPEGKANARAAILHDVLDKSGGLEDVSAKRFTSNLAKRAKQIGVTFSEDDKRSVDGFVRLMKATSRADDAALSPPTGIQSLPIIGGAVATDLLGGAGAGLASIASIGALARAYESPTMRRILVKVAKAPPGSKAERNLLSQAAKEMEKTMVSPAARGAQAAGITGQRIPEEGAQ